MLLRALHEHDLTIISLSREARPATAQIPGVQIAATVPDSERVRIITETETGHGGGALLREKIVAASSERMIVIADDSTDNTIAAVDSVVVDLILAVILVSLVMLLFLRSFRNSLIVLVAIPTSLVTAFAVM